MLTRRTMLVSSFALAATRALPALPAEASPPPAPMTREAFREALIERLLSLADQLDPIDPPFAHAIRLLVAATHEELHAFRAALETLQALMAAAGGPEDMSLEEAVAAGLIDRIPMPDGVSWYYAVNGRGPRLML